MSILVALNVFAQCVVHRSSHWICARCRSCLLFTLKAKAKEKALARYLVQLKVRDDESHPASDTLRAPLETPLSASHNHGARKKKKKKGYNFIEQRSIPPRQPPYLTRSSPTQHHFLQFYSPLLFFRPTPAAKRKPRRGTRHAVLRQNEQHSRDLAFVAVRTRPFLLARMLQVAVPTGRTGSPSRGPA
ncbi:hypothetical protein HDK90DRAFT_330281 [Phyllosticta capitalensis]|uniref:Secreted protein n=1 Tax=Phyllosticta capitalensis TaxID=121624 RepID=A0ABR1YIG8_9PEZI